MVVSLSERHHAAPTTHSPADHSVGAGTGLARRDSVRIPMLGLRRKSSGMSAGGDILIGPLLSVQARKADIRDAVKKELPVCTTFEAIAQSESSGNFF